MTDPHVFDRRCELTVWCEVCGREEHYSAADAFRDGWDFAGPGGMYPLGTITPRTCPDCPSSETTWWRLRIQKTSPDELTERDHAVIARIQAERFEV